ncbi:MAG: hypothetical protein WCK77_13570 [Verrucomicrobiota bacterium]
MLFLLQIAFGLAFLGYLVLACFDFVHGMYYILTGLALLAFGLTLKGILIVIRAFRPLPVPVPPTAPAEKVWTWRVIP